MPLVTAVRAAGPTRVRVELDGEAWRTFPLEVVAHVGLAEGAELDRRRLRALARELRRVRALEVATRALARRDLSKRGVRERLVRAGVTPSGAEQVVETLERAGLIDDGRFALARARALAERGLGDTAVRFDLERQGVVLEQIDGALAALEPEAERAERIVAQRGGGPAIARFLARRGFAEEAVEAAAEAPVAPGA